MMERQAWNGNLVGIVTSDVSAIVRGRFIPTDSVHEDGGASVGWLPANIALTPFGGIAENPFGSRGDLRILADPAARFQARIDESRTPFDLMIGNVVDLNGSPWPNCPRQVLHRALTELFDATGLRIIASFEQEFQILDASLPSAHPLSFAALRRADGFASALMLGLREMGAEPEVLIAEFGEDQFEVTCAPASPLVAADRCIAIREFTRELAQFNGWRATFSPKKTPDAVGNGLHIHFSLTDASGEPVGYDPGRPGMLSECAGAFCAGVIRHMRALTAITAPSVVSYLRLKPNSWSASYTWLGDRDREAGLRICPVTTGSGCDPRSQFNIEYRAADGTANPYLALAVIIWAGLSGVRDKLEPTLFSGDPQSCSEAERERLGLFRLPESLPEALSVLKEDSLLSACLPADLLTCFISVKQGEIAHFADTPPDVVCHTYAKLY